MLPIINRLANEPLELELTEKEYPEAIHKHAIHFTRLELDNIRHAGRNSKDNKASYRYLCELANDIDALVSLFGGFLGRILYYFIPTSWKARVYISNLERRESRGLVSMTWLMSDKEGHTVGECCLDEVEKDRYSLNDGATANLKIYNMGLMLHSSYQNRGIATQLAKLLLSHLDEMNNVKECGIDALLISVRPNDVKMNSFAKKLNFEFEKNVNIRVEGLLPCVSVTNIPNSLYLKRLSPTV